MIRTLIISFLVWCVGVSAHACTSRYIGALEKTILGGNTTHYGQCEVSIRRGWYKDRVEGDTAIDMGDGMVMQSFEMGACDSESATVLLDCSTGIGVITEAYDFRYADFGPKNEGTLRSEGAILYERLRQDGVSLSVDDVHLAARAFDGISRNEIASIADMPRIGGHEVDLACGCREFYPDSVGAMK